MNRYLRRALAGHFRKGRGLYLLTVLGVALGVASVLSIQILNRNALSAFRGSMNAVSGEADLTVLGTTPAFDESLLAPVLADRDVEAAWPLVRIDVTLEGRPDFFLQVIGADFFAPVRFPVVDGEGGEDRLAVPFLADPGWIAITPDLAEETGWAVGDPIAVTSGSRRAALRVGALVDFRKFAPLATRRLALMDIAGAQGLLGTAGRIHQIDIRLRKGAVVKIAARRLETILGPGVRVLAPEQREQGAEGLLEAFRLNLTALSLISLFVGLFLVYSSVQASLVRRRREFGILRSLGATRRQVFGLILVEVAILGAAGTAAGLPLGYAVASTNMDAVSATLTNLYLLSEIEALELSPFLFLLAAAVGIGGALLGALQPALEMSRRDTHGLLAPFTLHERTGRLAPRLAGIGALLLAGAGIWFFLAGRETRAGGFVLGSLLFTALPLFTPLVLRSVCGRVRAKRFGLGLSFRSLGVRLQTTSVAAAALAIAVSMLIGVTILIGSFRKTLETWIDTTIRADVYITTESWVRAGSEAFLTDELLADLAGHPDVTGAEKLRRVPVTTEAGRIQVAGLALEGTGGRPHFALRRGDPEETVRRLREEGQAVITEPLAHRAGIGEGDTLFLPGPRGETPLAVAAVSYDYGTDGGVVVHLDTFEKIFGPGPIQNVAFTLRPGADGDRVAGELKARFEGAPLVIRSNRQLRAEILQIFDQTFAVTRVLRVMALLTAVCGITLTLLILARERVAELALYRSLGATRSQIFRVFIGEGALLGMFGLVLGFFGGLALAAILIFVINRAYFGWTIRPAWPGMEIAREIATILAAAALAGVYPGLRAGRAPAEDLSRDDL